MTESRFTVTALNQIAEQSITCLIHYCHPEMFHLHAPPGDPEHHHDAMTSPSMTMKVKDGRVDLLLSILIHFTSSARRILLIFIRLKGPEPLKKFKFDLKEESHKISFVLTENLAPKHKEW